MTVRILPTTLVLIVAFGMAPPPGSGGPAPAADPPRFLSPYGGETAPVMLSEAASEAPQEVGLPARVVDWEPSSLEVRSFATTDYTDPEAGPRQGTTAWRTVGSTGNAAELWFTIARGGRILDLGGRYVNYSDDQGLTWKSVRPQEELVNAEGSVVQAPNGDIVAITWDPYSGDRVLSYKYTAAEDAWYYMYQPLHTPFWDRPSIEVVPGDFTDRLGNRVPYITFTNGFPHDPWQFSYDGLNYTEISSPARHRGPAISSWLDVEPDPMFDYIQPNNALDQGLIPKFAPLGGGRAWYQNLMFTASDMQWHPWTFPGGGTIPGALQVDSRGWLHNVFRTGGGFTYRTSTDGGRSWNSLAVQGGAAGDFRANGAAGVAAVWAINGRQDLAYKIDISTPQPRLLRRYVVGLGDDVRSGGIGFYGLTGGHRFDFSSIGVFPDGRIAVVFMDSKTKMPFPTLGNAATCAIKDIPPQPVGQSPCEVVGPQLAIELETTVPKLRDGFETGIAGWQQGAEVPADPDTGAPVAWSIAPSAEQAFAGQGSVRYQLDGRQGDGTIWVTRPVSLPPDKLHELTLGLEAWSPASSEADHLSDLVLYLGTEPPTGESSFSPADGPDRAASRSPLYQQAGWRRYELKGNIRPGPSGVVYVAAGISAASAAELTHYLDDLLLEVTTRP
jgi:hypothetical protein